MAIQQTRRALAPTQQPHRQPDVHPDMQHRMPSRPYRSSQYQSKDASKERLANGLGWFSIGLGLPQLLAPKAFSRFIGLADDHPLLIRFIGLREIMAGIGILSQRKPASWLWARVAGDAMDLALLGVSLSSDDSDRGRVAAAAAAVLGVTSLDILNAQQLSTKTGPHGDLATVHAITINRSPEEVYRFWRDFQNLPRFMSHLQSVEVIDDRRSHWVATAPAGSTVEWDAEITDDRPNQLISWRSLPGSDVDNSGTVRFHPAPADRGTEVRVEIEYNPPGGALGAGIAKLFGKAPEQQIKDDLYRFKQVMETGEVVRSEASIHPGMHPAKPPAGDGQQ